MYRKTVDFYYIEFEDPVLTLRRQKAIALIAANINSFFCFFLVKSHV